MTLVRCGSVSLYGYDGDLVSHGKLAQNGRLDLGADAIIESMNDLLVTGPIGSESRFVILHRASNSDGHRIIVGCWNNYEGGTLDELVAEIESKSDAWKAKYLAEYQATIALCRVRVANWGDAAIDRLVEMGHEVERKGGTWSVTDSSGEYLLPR